MTNLWLVICLVVGHSNLIIYVELIVRVELTVTHHQLIEVLTILKILYTIFVLGTKGEGSDET